MTVFGTGRVMRYAPEHEPALAAFRARCFPMEAPHRLPAYFSWMFLTNPQNGPQGPEVWTMLHEDRVVGHQGGIPCDLQVAGGYCRASWAVDLYVDPEWHMRGVGPALSAAHLDSCDLALALGVSDAAYKGYLRAGWLDLGRLDCFVRVLDARRLLASLELGNRALDSMMRAGGEFLRVIQGLRAALSMALTSLGRGRERMRFEEVAQFDARVNDVWETERQSYRIIQRRDLDYLRWRFDEAPHRARYRRFYLLRGDRAVGYAVMRLCKFHGAPICVIVDYLSAPGNAPALFGECLKAAAQHSATAAFCPTLNAPVRPTLRRLGFFSFGRFGAPRVLAHTVRPDLRALLGQRASWFLTLGDSDADHAWIS